MACHVRLEVRLDLGKYLYLPDLARHDPQTYKYTSLRRTRPQLRLLGAFCEGVVPTRRRRGLRQGRHNARHAADLVERDLPMPRHEGGAA